MNGAREAHAGTRGRRPGLRRCAAEICREAWSDGGSTSGQARELYLFNYNVNSGVKSEANTYPRLPQLLLEHSA